MKPVAFMIAAALALTGCSTDADPEGAESPTAVAESPAPALSYDSLQAADVELDLIITEQNYFAVWNVAWIVEPEISEDVALEPGSKWLVTYETTVPDAPTFTGEKYSFTVEVDAEGAATYSGNGLEVDVHPIGAHPDRLVLEIADVIER